MSKKETLDTLKQCPGHIRTEEQEARRYTVAVPPEHRHGAQDWLEARGFRVSLDMYWPDETTLKVSR